MFGFGILALVHWVSWGVGWVGHKIIKHLLPFACHQIDAIESIEWHLGFWTAGHLREMRLEL